MSVVRWGWPAGWLCWGQAGLSSELQRKWPPEQPLASPGRGREPREDGVREKRPRLDPRPLPYATAWRAARSPNSPDWVSVGPSVPSLRAGRGRPARKRRLPGASALQPWLEGATPFPQSLETHSSRLVSCPCRSTTECGITGRRHPPSPRSFQASPSLSGSWLLLTASAARSTVGVTD